MKLTKRTKRLLIAGALVLGLPIGAILLLAQNSARYPGAGVTTGDLFIASNYATTTLLTQISATSTSATVASGSGFVAPQLVSIDSEIVSVCQVSGNTLTFGKSSCPNADGRGYDGSVAVSHIASRPVEGRVVAWLHNQVAAEVIAIEMRPGGKFYAPAYVSLASAVAAANSASGTTVVPTGYTASVSSPVSISSAVECQPGALIQPTGTNLMATFGSGATIDGCTFDAHQSGNNTGNPCISIPGGSTHVTVRNSTVRNCGYFGIVLDGSTGVNSQIKILNSNFSGSLLDAVYSQGSLNDLEIAGNRADCSAGAPDFSHCFAVHSCYGASNTTCGTVQNVRIHDNIEACAVRQFCNEIGSFYNATPQPSSSFPTKVLLAHNICTNNPMQSAGCDSVGSVLDFDIDGDKFDSNNALTNNAPFEFVAANGAGRGLEVLNCNNASAVAVTVNSTSNFALSDSTLCGSIVFAVSPPIFFSPNIYNIRIHHNRITTMPGANPMGTASGCIFMQLNTTTSNGGHWHVDHNDCTGIGTSDNEALVYIANGNCQTGIDQLDISNNTINQIQYGLNIQAAGMCAVTRISYVHNIFGPGVAEFGPQGPLPYHDNPPFQASAMTGPIPTCTYGPGSGASGTPCAVFVGPGQTSTTATPWDSIVYANTSGAPASAGSTIFTLGVPAGVFALGSPVCSAREIWTGLGATPINLDVQYNIASTATSLIFVNTVQAIAGNTYAYAIHCAPYLP